MGRGEKAEGDALAVAAVAALRGDDDAHAVRVHRVHGHDLGDRFLDLFIERYARIQRHKVVDLRPGNAQIEVFKNGVCSVRDSCDPDLALATAAGIGAGKLTEGPFASADARKDVALQHDLGAGRDIEIIGGIRPDDIHRHPVLQSAREGILALVIGNRRGSHKAYDGVVADRDRNRQRLVFGLGFFQLQREIVESKRLDPQLVPSLDLQAVGPDVHLIEIVGILGIGRDDRGFGYIKTTVLGIDPVEGEHVEDVDIFRDHVFLAGRVLAFYYVGLHGVFVPPSVELHKLLFDRGILVQSEHQRRGSARNRAHW